MSPRLHPKLQGEAAESVFLQRAIALGFTVSKPWGDSAAYDFIVDAGRRLHRVQVKSVTHARHGAYRFTACRGSSGKVPYSPEEVDFLAAYVFAEDAWYLIPIRALGRRKMITLCPHRPSRRRFEKCREAWHLLHPGISQGARLSATEPAEAGEGAKRPLSVCVVTTIGFANGNKPHGTSPEGGICVSPARQRWVGSEKNPEPRRGGTQL